jgi:hypothetical protein
MNMGQLFNWWADAGSGYCPKQGHYDKIVSNIQELSPEVEELP